MVKCTAFILARKGSRGIPGKNIKLCAGKPLMAWSIEAALGAKHIDRVIVSTDSKEYAAIARQYGAQTPFIRPAELSTDNSTSVSALVHAMKAVGMDLSTKDEIALMSVLTVPLITSEDIDNLIEILVAHPDANMAMATQRMGVIAGLYRRDSEGYLGRIVDGPQSEKNRQDLESFYRAGYMHAFRVHEQLKCPTTYPPPPTMGCLMSSDHLTDIDTLEDFELAEQLLLRRMK